ncbi:hypothetical protein GCM10009801_73140 [Streptomyces albiaxialis]|uniref:Uncharacterized protein n=1 Tax=Streptomyces albiaxialis TaxID=329523 RepID=A0ABP5ILD0_9ACTN
MSPDFGLTWGDPDESEETADALATVDTTREQRQQAQAEEVARQVEAAVEAATPSLSKIPDPVAPAGDGPLTVEERERRDRCEEGIDLLNKAYYIAGKSLDTMAVGRLFRDLPHKEDPARCYETIEEWAWVEKGLRQSRASKLRAGWELGEILAARGYDAPLGQVLELVPVKNAHGIPVAVGVYELVVKSAGAAGVTAARLREVVRMLPGDLALKDEDPMEIAKTLQGQLVAEEPGRAPAPAAPAVPREVRQSVDRRAVMLADRLDRGRIPRGELMLHLLRAFADDQDSTVFDAVLARMKEAGPE